MGHAGLMPDENLDLPEDLAACHDLIRRLRQQNQELHGKLAICEENERQVYRRLYGPGTDAKTLLNFGLLMAGQESIIRSPNPDDPTVGEVYARERAERLRDSRIAAQNRNNQGSVTVDDLRTLRTQDVLTAVADACAEKHVAFDL